MFLINFDIVILLFIAAFMFYAYTTGLHSQIKIFIIYILPFFLLYYVGGILTRFIYQLPPVQTVGKTYIANFIPSFSQFVTVLLCYALAYLIILITNSFIFKFFSREKYREKFITKLGPKEKPLGISVGLINMWVMIYFMVLPAYTMQVTSRDNFLTDFFMSYPPTFSRIGRAAKNADPVITSTSSLNTFESFISGKGFDVYYNKLFSYQVDIFEEEEQFKENTIAYLDNDVESFIEDVYFVHTGVELPSNGHGVFRIFYLTEAELGLDFDSYNDDGEVSATNVYDALIELNTISNNSEVSTSDLSKAKETADPYKGLIIWYMDELNGKAIEEVTEGEAVSGDSAAVINSFKANYETISDNVTDKGMSHDVDVFYSTVMTYDMFDVWYEFVKNNYDIRDPYNVANPELVVAKDLDPNLTPDPAEDYDFAAKSIDLTAFLLAGDNLSYAIIQFRYDYEDGEFDVLKDITPELKESLEKVYELSVKFEEEYKYIVMAMDKDIPAVARLGLAVARLEADVFQTMEDSLVIAALINDGSTMCGNRTNSQVPGYTDIEVCEEVNSEGIGILQLLTNSQYIITDYIVKAYILYDEENNKQVEVGYYDEEKMTELLDFIEDSKNKLLFSDKFIDNISHQIAFAEVTNPNPSNGLGEKTTLLKYMIQEDLITYEGINVLANADHLFSDEFCQFVLDVNW